MPPADMPDIWSDPQLYQDFIPVRNISMAAATRAAPAVQHAQTASWRPARVYPPEKHVPPPVPRRVARPLIRATQIRRRRRPDRVPRHLQAAHGRVSPAAPRVATPLTHTPTPTSRVTLTDYRGFIIYDTQTNSQPVSDYREAETGLSPATLAAGMRPRRSVVRVSVTSCPRQRPRSPRSSSASRTSCRARSSSATRSRCSQVMGLSHPAIDTRDTALFLPFRRSLRYRPNTMVPLVTLVSGFMARTIGQHGEQPVCTSQAVSMSYSDRRIFDRSNMPVPPSTSSGLASRSGKGSSLPAPGLAPCLRNLMQTASCDMLPRCASPLD